MIIKEIAHDTLKTIVEFCYKGEILVSKEKLEEIVAAAKFLQIEGAKDFVLPTHVTSVGGVLMQTTTTGDGDQKRTKIVKHTFSKCDRLQIDLQSKKPGPLSKVNNQISELFCFAKAKMPKLNSLGFGIIECLTIY